MKNTTYIILLSSTLFMFFLIIQKLESVPEKVVDIMNHKEFEIIIHLEDMQEWIGEDLNNAKIDTALATEYRINLECIIDYIENH